MVQGYNYVIVIKMDFKNYYANIWLISDFVAKTLQSAFPEALEI